MKTALIASLVVLLGACADPTADRPLASAAPPAQSDPPTGDAPPTAPTPGATKDAGGPSAPACAATLGTAITPEFGRLDGTIRAVTPPGDHTCPGDNDHVILQIDAAGATYAVWVNVQSTTVADPDVRFETRDAPLAGPVWESGWHARAYAFDYVKTLGVHSDDASFQTLDRAALSAQIVAHVTPGANVSVFMTGFDTADGGHLVHRNHAGADGAVVVLGAGTVATYLLFHFSEQTF